jgi:hypothetical protein
MAGLRRAKSKKIKPISNVSAQTNLFEEDEREVSKMVKATGKTRADVLRSLVASGIRARRLQAVGKDEALTDVINAQRSVVSASQEPLIEALNQEKKFVEKAVSQMQEEYVIIQERLMRIERALGLLIKCSERILQNAVIIRALLLHYVFYFYYSLRAGFGNKVSEEELRQSYKERMQEIRDEAKKERMLCDEEAFEGTVTRILKDMVREAGDWQNARQ